VTHIVWWGWPTRAEYDRGSLEDNGDAGRVMYQDFFPEGPEFTYHRDLRTLPAGVGAVVIINALISNEGCAALGIESPFDVHFVNERIKSLPWVIVFVVDDVDSHYDLDNLRHPNMKIWTEFAKPRLTAAHPGCHSHVPQCHHLVRRLPEGYERWTTLWKKPSLYNRPIDWFFAGQSLPLRHGDWLVALQRLTNHLQPLSHDDAVFLKYEGRDAKCQDIGRLPIVEYIAIMRTSKIVICRPENCMPETTRLYSTLESGCIPIVSERPAVAGAFRDQYDWNGYWEYMLGEKPPFPVVKNPADLDEVMQRTLDNWPQNAIHVAAWWADYKTRLCATLKAEIQAIQ
jgi:hypothetical protein